jgi:hypothetical protein
MEIDSKSEECIEIDDGGMTVRMKNVVGIGKSPGI